MNWCVRHIKCTRYKVRLIQLLNKNQTGNPNNCQNPTEISLPSPSASFAPNGRRSRSDRDFSWNCIVVARHCLCCASSSWSGFWGRDSVVWARRDEPSARAFDPLLRGKKIERKVEEKDGERRKDITPQPSKKKKKKNC